MIWHTGECECNMQATGALPSSAAANKNGRAVSSFFATAEKVLSSVVLSSVIHNLPQTVMLHDFTRPACYNMMAQGLMDQKW